MSKPPELRVRSDFATAGLLRPDREPVPDFDRVRRGVYAESGSVAGMSKYDRRYLLTVHASSRTLTGEHIYSHESAAALLGIPTKRPWPKEVHLICERRSGGRSQLDVKRHCLGLEDVSTLVVDGLVVTSPARTAFDFALSRPFEDAVVVMDAVLRLYPDAVHELAQLVHDYGRRRGWARVRAVWNFADGASGSVGESISRCRMHFLGFVKPELQVRVRTSVGDEFGDFGWEEVRALGEFDGETKYRLDRYRKGGTIEDIVVREKNRENRLRVQWPNIARWDAEDIRENRLESILLQARVPKRNH